MREVEEISKEILDEKNEKNAFVFIEAAHKISNLLILKFDHLGVF